MLGNRPSTKCRTQASLLSDFDGAPLIVVLLAVVVVAVALREVLPVFGLPAREPDEDLDNECMRCQ